MDDLIQQAAALWESAPRSDELRLVGGLAVRLLVGQASRVTHDLDVVAMTIGAGSSLQQRLRDDGWKIGTMTGWWRASKGEPHRLFVDVATHPVISPTTFDSITLRAPPVLVDAGGSVAIHVAAPDDLAVLKLIAARDQDLLDLMLLADRELLHVEMIAKSAALDDVERSIARGTAQLRDRVASELDEITAELLGRMPGASERDALRTLFESLSAEGL